jgi:hypothetical protein
MTATIDRFISGPLLALVAFIRRRPLLTVGILAVLFAVGNMSHLLAAATAKSGGDSAGRKAAAWLAKGWARLTLVYVPMILGFPLIGWLLAAWWLLDVVWPDRGAQTKDTTE